MVVHHYRFFQSRHLPLARPFPCAVADDDTVAHLQQLAGPTSDGSTHLVVRRGTSGVVEATVPGAFDTCGAGPGGAVLATNDNWGGSAALSVAFTQVGAFPFSSVTSKDSAGSSG